MSDSITHIPALKKEVVEYLLPALENGGILVDGTVGGAGHAKALTQRFQISDFRFQNKLKIIGIDKDLTAIEIAKKNLKEVAGKNINIELVKGDFGEIVLLLKKLNISKVNAILLDLGVSSQQLEDSQRGFSFRREAALDMRMDATQYLTADQVVNAYEEKRLVDIIFQYSEDRFARKIAKAIVQNRPIKTTTQLAELVEKCVPPRFRKNKIHPATQTFQAIRIEVNQELESLKQFLNSFGRVLENNGRCAVISFHSLEDRLVKNKFQELALSGQYKTLTDLPITPAENEIANNPRSRSAKMRVIEKIQG